PEASSPIVIHEQDDDEDDLPQVMETPQPKAQKRESKPEIKTGTLLTSTSIKNKANKIRRSDYSSAIQPSLSLLESQSGSKYAINRKELEQFSKLVESR